MASDRSKEPLLNRLAAYATNSEFTHVEIAIGEELSQSGLMRNVVRIFNDVQGVEVTERTGINPHFSYMSMACTAHAEMMMLSFARKQIGKPFSMIGMIRSVLWPRETQGNSWYCAELVAAVMKVGGLIESSYNPGEATPENLYKRFRGKCATAANPFVLNRLKQHNPTAFATSAIAPTRHSRSFPLVPPPTQEELGPLLPGRTSRPHPPMLTYPSQIRTFPSHIQEWPPSRTSTNKQCAHNTPSLSFDSLALRTAVKQAGVLHGIDLVNMGSMYDRV